MKKVISTLLVFSMLAVYLSIGVVAAGNTDYTIINPYENVNWDTFKTYKANLHTHTAASDGELTLTEMVQAYYEKDYDILAITDHGVINTGWRDDRETYPIFNSFRKFEPMSEDDYQRITTGSDRGGRGMIDIPGGIECNMAVISKTHVNGYFTTYGSGVGGRENDYKTATVEIEKSGGYSVLNHVGDWVDSENHPERAHYDSFITYFTDIFTTSKSCLGMEIINNTDRVTREDRVLWDELLEVVIPTGRNIWGFADDDSESLGDVGRSFELFPLEENTVENVKNAMVNGSFFAASKYDKTIRGGETEGDSYVPVVSNIIVDQEENTITVEVDPSRDCSKIEWVSNGEVFSDDFKIDLNNFENKLGCYVRFKLFGSGGVTYSQAFELKYDGRTDSETPQNSLSEKDNMLYQNIVVALISLIIEKITGLFN